VTCVPPPRSLWFYKSRVVAHKGLAPIWRLVTRLFCWVYPISTRRASLSLIRAATMSDTSSGTCSLVIVATTANGQPTGAIAQLQERRMTILRGGLASPSPAISLGCRRHPDSVAACARWPGLSSAGRLSRRWPVRSRASLLTVPPRVAATPAWSRSGSKSPPLRHRRPLVNDRFSSAGSLT
jgi:hypothetical protein